ncbi:MAG: MCE family protein [Actinobacteria bacterium]|nr:MCE family protein [Actinomycetota bacterium]
MRRLLVIALALLATGLIVLLPGAVGADDGPYKIRAIFDNGGFIVKDEEVRVAGATIGTVESVDVTGPEEIVSLKDGGVAIPGKAVVVLNITDDAFKDFRADASCIIRPQSLIGEKLVDCTPTQPRAPGTEPPPELETIEDGPGEGQLLLPLENNGKAVDLDLIQNINRAPYRDRFRLIINDLGAGLAARGDDLGEVIDRANPALRQTNRVLKILADQNRQLASLASDGDAVLEPLARNRTSITGFFRNAGIAGQATAERGADLEAQLKLFPETLRQVRATMKDLRGFGDQGTPLAQDIGASAVNLSKATQSLPAFLKAGTPALTTLGDADEVAGPNLVASDPVIVQIRNLTDKSGPTAVELGKVLGTFSDTGGFQHLMDFIYNTVGNINGYDTYGHFQRAAVQRSNCLVIEITVFPSCEAFFIHQKAAGATASAQREQKPKAQPKAGLKPAEPDEPLPPVEEIIPELEPEPEETTTTEPTEPLEPSEGDEEDAASGDEASAEGAAAGDEELTAEEKAKRKRKNKEGEDAITMDEASLLLRFLLGGGR